jgi:hypothetical protein
MTPGLATVTVVNELSLQLAEGFPMYAQILDAIHAVRPSAPS